MTPPMSSSPAATPVTVFVHIHYPEIWRDMAVLLAKRLAHPFHLVMTTSGPPDEIVLPQTPHLLSHRILTVENRGRDILPFLRALATTPDFEIGLKLHTKKSPQRADGARWLSELLDSLVPSPQGTEAIVTRLHADRRIGFVTPAGFCLPVKPWILVNGPAMQRTMSTIADGLCEADMDGAYFAAGSMFWFRRPALWGLADDRLPALFESEEGQLDGTMAHGMERLFPVEARRQGFLTVAMPVLMKGGPDTAASILVAATQAHTEEPNFLFPAPYISPASAEFGSRPLRSGIFHYLSPAYRALPAPLRQLLKRLAGR
jgi:lipopolysaccharide biosynthesis protein